MFDFVDYFLGAEGKISTVRCQRYCYPVWDIIASSTLLLDISTAHNTVFLSYSLSR